MSFELMKYQIVLLQVKGSRICCYFFYELDLDDILEEDDDGSGQECV